MTDRTSDARLTIGQFGRLSQLSRKALRLYDDRGLLAPARIDPDSGYRYYTRAQIATARRIRLLRLMEMPLEKIAVVLDAWDEDIALAQRLIQTHVSAVEKQLAAVQSASTTSTPRYWKCGTQSAATSTSRTWNPTGTPT